MASAPWWDGYSGIRLFQHCLLSRLPKETLSTLQTPNVRGFHAKQFPVLCGCQLSSCTLTPCSHSCPELVPIPQVAGSSPRETPVVSNGSQGPAGYQPGAPTTPAQVHDLGNAASRCLVHCKASFQRLRSSWGRGGHPGEPSRVLSSGASVPEWLGRPPSGTWALADPGALGTRGVDIFMDVSSHSHDWLRGFFLIFIFNLSYDRLLTPHPAPLPSLEDAVGRGLHRQPAPFWEPTQVDLFGQNRSCSGPPEITRGSDALRQDLGTETKYIFISHCPFPVE